MIPRVLISLLILIAISLPSFICAQIIHIGDLTPTNRAGQFTIFNPDSLDGQYGTPIAGGDLNEDGLDDLVISAMAGDGPNNLRQDSGEVSVYFSSGVIAGEFDLRRSDPQVLTLFGEKPGDIFGIKSHIADIDADGLGDLLVGAFYADVDSISDAGRLYLFSGTLLTDLQSKSQTLDLALPWPENVSLVNGPHQRSRLGV
jgi:hypothetical protein